jgi:LysM repeat protein
MALSVLLSVSLSIALPGNSPMDSIGLKTINGREFIMHRIKKGETLFSLSRRYHTTVAHITEHNKLQANDLAVNDTILILHTAPSMRTHVVQEEETLFSLSQRYGVSTNDLIRWNHLSDTRIDIGQPLMVGRKTDPSASGARTHTVKKGETLYSLSRQYGIPLDSLKRWNGMDNYAISINQKLVLARPSAPAPVHHAVAEAYPEADPDPGKTTEPVNEVTKGPVSGNTHPVTHKTIPAPVVPPSLEEKTMQVTVERPAKADTTANRKGFTEIRESGIASLIDRKGKTKKYLALHPTAPIGTILTVKNEMTGQTVFTRVVGKLPNTGNNKNIILRITHAAYERLGGVNDRFPVQISYMPN